MKPPTWTMMRPDVCPHCGARLTAAVDPTGQKRPAPGDLTICIECARLLTYDAHLHVRTLHADEEYRYQQIYGAQIDEMRRRLALAKAQGAPQRRNSDGPDT